MNVHHRCVICKEKVHGALCTHANESTWGGPILTCFLCQDHDPGKNSCSIDTIVNAGKPFYSSQSTCDSNKMIDLFVMTKSNCQSFVEKSDGDNKYQRIFAMSIGMKEAASLTDFDREPYKNCKKSKYKPSNQVLYEDIVCHAQLQGTTLPRYSNKKEVKKTVASSKSTVF